MKLSHTISVGLVSTLSLVFVVAFAPTASGQITLADARGDFVAGTNDGDPGIIPATGTGEWQYLASDTVNPTLDPSLDVLAWLIVNQRYQKFTTSGSANIVGLVFGLAPGELSMHPSAAGRSPSFDVVRWIAGPGEAGTINIAGNVRKTDAGGGSGVTFDLFVDGNSVFNFTVGGADTVGSAFDETATVGVGSTVDFVVGPNGGDCFDSTALKATITLDAPTCFSPVFTIDGLRAEVDALTSLETKNDLNDALDDFQEALDSGMNDEARTAMEEFIEELVDGSNREETDPDLIPLDEANNLICGAANVLIGIALP